MLAAAKTLYRAYEAMNEELAAVVVHRASTKTAEAGGGKMK